MKFKNGNEGVSPVIGVILMVAITVVLAAVVFVLVQNLGDNVPDSPLSVSISRNGDNSFSVVSIDDTVGYGNLTVKDNGISQTFTVNGATPLSSQIMKAGDLIRVSGLTTGSHRVQFIYQNDIVFSSEFTV